MALIKTVLVILHIFSAGAFLLKYPELEQVQGDGGDPGEPLFLTPLIEAGNITEGRELARVKLTDVNITSYAGYFTANKTYNSNQFFWYFPPINSSESAPVVVWLEGGPGGSMLSGIFFENGPLQVNKLNLEQRNYTWALNHHMIYIDNPVGTGFSFTEDPKGYCTDELQVGEELYSTIVQFFQLFPELLFNEFFITGASYAGKYVPALAYTIHTKNPTAKLRINLKGMAIGNGLSDPINQMHYSEYFYQLGLLDWNQANIIKENETQIINYIKEQKWREAFDADNEMYLTWQEMMGLDTLTNFLATKNYLNSTNFTDFSIMLKRSSFRHSIHVGNLTYHGLFSIEAYKHLSEDIMQSVASWISELLDYYRLVVYTGQLDLIVPYSSTENYLRNLNFTGAEEYQTAKRNFWMIDGDVAGYVKKAGNLTEIMVRNAGHGVSIDQPQWGLDLITRFTHGKSFA